VSGTFLCEYDVVNQLTKIADALNGEQQFTYDVEANVQTFTDVRGKVTTFEYDLLNRQTTRIAHGRTFMTTFTYDTRDNLKTTTDPKGHSSPAPTTTCLALLLN